MKEKTMKDKIGALVAVSFVLALLFTVFCLERVRNRLRFHWQNLNDGSNPKRGSILRHGRAWILGRFHWEWVIPDYSLGFSFHKNSQGWTASVHLLLVTLYIGWGESEMDGRKCKVKMDMKSCTLFWSVWADTMESRRDDRWYQRTHVIEMGDLFLGRRQYTCTEIGLKEEISVVMPEGTYWALAQRRVSVWWRRRWAIWPCVIRKESCSIEIPGGIPFEGKGEDSWNCGEDGLFGVGSDGHDLGNAAETVARIAMQNRRRYGTPSRIRSMIESRGFLNMSAKSLGEEPGKIKS